MKISKYILALACIVSLLFSDDIYAQKKRPKVKAAAQASKPAIKKPAVRPPLQSTPTPPPLPPQN